MTTRKMGTSSESIFRIWLTTLRSGSSVLLVSAALTLVTGVALAAPETGARTDNVSPVFHMAKGATMLYNQNSHAYTFEQDSQNFTSGLNTSSNDSGADDFVVPKGQTWKVTEVDATGTYWDGGGPAASVNVIFYKNWNNMPGAAMKGGTFDNLSCIDNSGSFGCSLGKGVKLKSGHYWLAVVANCSIWTCGEWGWKLRGPVQNDEAMWQNPGGGFSGGCATWQTISDCGAPKGDLMFDLQGKIMKRSRSAEDDFKYF